ncbi:MAG: hypothetical protein HYY17_06425 [Planctomycetes bacterium]|nr:hypothetical protein [Planctomycetota bacterium]
MIGLLAVVATLAFSQETKDEPGCECVWYDSATCACAKECARKCTKCDGKGDACPCIADLKRATGTIRGVLKSPYAKLAEGVVYIEEVKDRKFVPPTKNPRMDQKNKIFIPHALPVLVGSTVDFPNTDDVRHNVYTEKGSPFEFNLGEYAAGVVKHVTPDKAGVLSLRCNVHTEMYAYIVVCPNPYFGTTDKKGATVIRNVPPGKYRLTFFHEKLKSKTIEVTVEAGKDAAADFTGLERRS